MWRINAITTGSSFDKLGVRVSTHARIFGRLGVCRVEGISGVLDQEKGLLTY